MNIEYGNKKKPRRFARLFLLSYLDSNQDKLIQSQMCYRYTIGQSQLFSFSEERFTRFTCVLFPLKSGCKSTNFLQTDKIFFYCGMKNEE